MSWRLLGHLFNAEYHIGEANEFLFRPLECFTHPPINTDNVYTEVTLALLPSNIVSVIKILKGIFHTHLHWVQ